ncbi:hypothetical protein GFH30_06300 [Acinetobacter wanghuae]|uniref:XRE family transcriptional regulator n=1 Tax=Acinetobacter wanghuae TaxID=2662362 RepID=A0ABX6CZV0_9GAMM|nr:hypothetical protein [Acinetobacter wanghuae]QGA11025.1 hypothetical protein GFH30_06300 [Acinetobacter wanghuae]
MKVDDLKNHLKCKSLVELEQKLGVSNATLWKWETNGIPIKTQCFFEVKYKGAIKADRALIA